MRQRHEIILQLHIRHSVSRIHCSTLELKMIKTLVELTTLQQLGV